MGFTIDRWKESSLFSTIKGVRNCTKRAMAPKGKGAVGIENPLACVFCKTEEDDELKYGKFVHVEQLSVHHNCMFFSSGLQQRSSSSSGLIGFNIEDIKKEVNRGNKLRCTYCKQYGATVGCCIGTCRKTFHLHCGMNNGTLNQYFGTFNSYCEVHKPVQTYVKTPRAAFHCHICYSSLSKRPIEDCLYVPCCKNNWYHKDCIQKYATSAGQYFFNCPMCKNSSEFTKVTQTYGIHIPERDASWELEENAFQELYHRPECGASPCHCHDGKNYEGDGEWELLFCKLCGSKATHRFCEKISENVEYWHCNECKVMEDQISKQVVLPKVSSQESSQNKPLNIQSQASFLSSKEPSFNNINLSSHASSILSVSSLDRALKCVVAVMPVKIVKDDNGLIRPLLRPNQEFVNVKPMAKNKATKHSKYASTQNKKFKIASVEINKLQPEKISNCIVFGSHDTGPLKKTMKVLTFIFATTLVSGGSCTVLAATGYVASTSRVRNLLITTGLANVIKSSSDSLYAASGFRYHGDQGTEIRKAVMKDYNIVETSDSDSKVDNNFRKKISVTRDNVNEERDYSERLFGVLNKMDKNTCIAKLLCEIGADPLSFGAIGLKIKHYVTSVPPVTWNSETFPYISAFQSGLSGGKNVCKRDYNTCSYDLNRVMDFLWFFINPVRL
ncbi:hypothetical protein JTE90_021890 [Oedothorax gibbosus]|uniref:PHD-type domain-containing protein n=1 Tax=Oedothorax gibbosus TaxID=931172 RepID=A0AAV6V092_9ARAC|nr:hypothetical protein JTE90_021890 [Oedothorax gibbosus]